MKVIIATNSFSLTFPRFPRLLVKNWKFPDFSLTIWDKIWFPDFSLILLISRLAGNPGDEEDLSNLKEAANAAVAGAGDTVDLSSDEDEDKILDADESGNSDVENNNAEENQAVEDEDVNNEEVNKGEDAFEDNEGKDKQEHDAMDVVV